MSAFLFKALIISFAFFLCFSNPIQGRHDASLDPNRVLWWRTRWSPLAIELSSINAESVGVSITLRWSPSTDIPLGIIELELPREFYIPGGNLILSEPISSIKAGEDYTTHFSTLIENPVSGVYGPVKVRTRYFATGQIVDVNENFSLLAIAPKEKSENSNLLVYLDSTPRVGDINKELRVSFNLLQNIYKYDIVTIGVDLRWVMSDIIECSSYKEAGNMRYFSGTDEKDRSKIACSVDKIEDRQYIQVYGLGNDIDISNETASSVELRFKYVSVPKARYENYDWSLKVSRFGTRWVYQSSRYTQGPAIQIGSIISGSWKPASSYIERSSITAGMSLYIDISIPILNTIPVGGSMNIVLTDKVNPSKYHGNTENGCWVMSPKIEGMICIADMNTNSLVISGFQEEIQPRTIVVTTVVDFTSKSFGIKAVNTYGEYLESSIDTGANIDIASISSSNRYINALLNLEDGGYFSSSSFQAARPLPNQYLVLVYDLPSSSNCFSGYKYRFFLPFTQTKGEDQLNKFYFYPQATYKYLQILYFYSPNYYRTYYLESNSVKFTIESDRSYIDFENNLANPCNPQTFGFKIGLFDTGESTTFPMIASNPSTRYSILLEMKHPDYPGVTYYGSHLLNIVPAPLSSLSYEVYTNQQTPGNLGIVKFTAAYDYPSFTSTTNTYYLEIAFPDIIDGNLGLYEEYLGSGLKDGDSYPVSCTNFVNECSSTIWYDGSYTYLIFKNPSIQSGTTYTINFTYGKYPLAGFSNLIYMRFYYTPSNDSSGMKHISYEHSANYRYYSNQNYSGISLDISVDSDSITLTQFHYTHDKIVISVYGGYSFSDSTQVLSKSTMKEITQNKKIYNVAGKWSLLYAEVTSSPSEIVLKGFSIPKYSDKLGITLSYYYMVNINAIWLNSYKLIQATGNLTKVKVMPNSVKARGSTLPLTDMTVSFTTAKEIPAGGQIAIEINNKWDISTVKAECKITGLEAVTGKSLTCSISNNLFVISNLNLVKTNTSVSITIQKLIPPTYSSTTSLFNTITTYADSSFSLQIDTFDAIKSTEDDIALTVNSDSTGSTVLSYLLNLPSSLNTDSTSIFMTFSLSNTIPAGSIFLITFNNIEWLHPIGDIKHLCWIRGFKYQRCEKVTSGIRIILGEDLVSNSNSDIYLENCIRTPSFSSTIENAIQFSASYNSLTIISDSRGHTYNPTIIPKTISASISLSVRTFGEASNYTFSILSNKVMSTGDEVWILFPGEYDFYIGDVIVDSDSTVFTLKCEGNNVECVVDHRIVIIRGISTSAAYETVSLSLINVYNPNVSITGNIVIAHYDPVAKVFKGIGMISGEDINITSPSRLVITKIDITNRVLEKLSDYEIWFEFSGTLNENIVIYVKFPSEFVINEGSTYSCTLYQRNLSVFILANTICSYKYNSLFFQLSKSQSRSFSSSTLLSLKISNITNNLNPLPRLNPISDWERDLTDSTTFPKYAMYSSRFSLYILSKSSNTILSKSYYEMNPAYLGYYSSKPQAKIIASTTASACENITVDGSSSIGDDLTYSWEVISDMSNNALAQFNSSLKSGYSSSILVIPSSVLKPSVITVNLRVSNQSYSDSVSVSIKVNEFEAPILEFLAGDSVTVSYSRDYTIRLSVKLPNCSSFPTDVSYEWSISPASSKFISPNKPENTISKGSLLPGVYTITAKFSVPSIPNYTHSASMMLTIQSSELIAIITGGNRKHNISKELVLDGSSSYDPDNLTTSLAYSWQCFYQNTPCQLTDNIEYNKSIFRIPPNNLEYNRVYTITLIVSINLRQSTASTDITATNDDVPDVYILPPGAKFLPTVSNTLKVVIPEGINLKSMKWSCNIPSVQFSASADFNQINIKEFTLQGGEIHTFTFTADYKEFEILSTMDVYVDAPPSPGEFIISPESGTSLKTLFSFLAQNWTDKENDLPLSYELYRVTESTALKIGILNGNREFKTVLPAGNVKDDYNVEFILRVYDSLGAYTEVLYNIKVGPSNDIYVDALDYIERMMNNRNYEESGDIPSNLKTIADTLRSDERLDIEKTRDILSKAMDLLENYYNFHDSPTEISLIYSAIASLTSLHTNATIEIVDETLYLIDDILYQAPATDKDSLTFLIKIMSNLQSSIIPSLSSSNFNLTSYRIHETIQKASLMYLSSSIDTTYPQEISTPSLYIQLNRLSSETFSSSISINTPTAFLILPSLTNKIQDALLDSGTGIIDYVVSQTNHRIFSHSSDESIIGYLSLDLYLSGIMSSGEVSLQPIRRIIVQNLVESIQISLPFNYESDSEEFVCVYLNESSKNWSPGGCRFVEKVGNERVICECNHLSLFSAIGNMERISVEDYNEIETINIDEIDSIEDDDRISFSIVILIGALIFIQILISAYGVYKDNKQANRKFRLVNLSNLPLEHSKTTNSRKPSTRTDQDHALVSPPASDPNNIEADPNVPINHLEVLPVDTHNLMLDITIERIPEEVQECDKLDLNDAIIDESCNISISQKQQAINTPDNTTNTVISVQNLKNKDKSCLEWTVLEHEFLGFFMRYDIECSRVLRILVFFTGNFLGIFIIGLLYNRNLNAENEQESESALEILKEYGYIDVLYNLVANCVGIICFILRVMVNDIEKEGKSIYKLLGVILSCIIGMGSIAGSVIFSLEYHVIDI